MTGADTLLSAGCVVQIAKRFLIAFRFGRQLSLFVVVLHARLVGENVPISTWDANAQRYARLVTCSEDFSFLLNVKSISFRTNLPIVLNADGYQMFLAFSLL